MLTKRREAQAMRALAAAVAAATAVGVGAADARAADRTWIAGNGFWDIPGNWSPAVMPGAGDNAFLLQSDATNRQVTYYNSALTPPTLSSITINSTNANSIITLRQDASYPHALPVTTEYVGTTGFGSHVMTGGSHTVNTLYVGYNNGGRGAYDQWGGTVSAGNVYLGYNAGSRGTFATLRLPDQPLPSFSVTGNLEVGRAGEGFLLAGKGTTTVGDQLSFGVLTGSKGTLVFTGGTLNGNDANVGIFGEGSFNLHDGSSDYTQGAVNLTGDLFFGLVSGSKGTAQIAADHSLTARFQYVGTEGVGDAMHMEKATNNARILFVGYNNALDNKYQLRDQAVLNTSEQTVVANNTGAKGTFTQTGGTHTIGSVAAGTGSLTLGTFGSTEGKYALSNYTEASGGGSLSTADQLSAGTAFIGRGGKGTFDHDGGTARFTNVYLGYDSTGEGTWNVLGDGSSNVTDTTRLFTTNLVVGYNGKGTFNQTSTLANSVSTTTLTIAANAGSTGRYNLSGGTLAFTGTGRTLTNRGHFEKTGGSLSGSPTLNNYGTFVHSGNAFFTAGTNFQGGVIQTNTGSFRANTFTNDGAFNSSGNTTGSFLTLFGTATVGATGYFAMGVGDRLFILDDFFSTSTRATDWRTDEVFLVFNDSAFTPTVTNHQFQINGVDLGADPDAYVNNFCWDRVGLAADDTLTLLDGSSAPGGALYVSALILENGLSQLGAINSNGLNIYYDPAAPDSAWLSGQTYTLTGGGQLIPVPEPASLAVLALGAAGLLARRRRG